MKATQYTPNKLHEFLLFECDWKDNLDRKEMNRAMRHVNKVKGEFEELDVHVTDGRLFYAGPEGISSWIYKTRNSELEDSWCIFMDNSTAGESDSPIYAEAFKWYFDGEEVYVMVPTEWNDKKKKYMNKLYLKYSDWLKMAEEMNADL